MLYSGLSVCVISAWRASRRAFRVRSTMSRSSPLNLTVIYPTSLNVRLRLLQPEGHAHLAVHAYRGGQLLLGHRLVARPTVELAEAEVAVGGEWTHAELVGPRERLPVVAFRRPHVGRVARGGDFAEEAQRPALETSLPAPARARESLLRSFPPFLHLAR